VFYRVWQFLRAAFAPVRRHERRLVERYLSPPQVTLFSRMPRCDQRHGLDVFHTLRRAGHCDPVLLQAALLHDVGKTVGELTIVHRVLVVLIQRFAPQMLVRLAADGHSWKAPFAVHARHPEVGAERALGVGCPTEVVDLIRRHHGSAHRDDRLAALQWADRQN
jgi:putative nucleotidyltransferase with HDIG domain